MKQYDIGIDLGTTSIIIATEEQGVVFRQPTIGAVDTRTNTIIAVGDEALQMVGRAPAYIDLVRPLRDGVIQDHRMTNELIVRFVNEVCRSRIFKPRIAVCVPAQITGVEADAVVESVMGAGAKQVFLVDEPVAAALGAGLQIREPHGCMVVDIGGGSTDIAVISMGGRVKAASVPVAGNAFDRCIAQYVQEKFQIAIGPLTAEALKKQVACCTKSEFEGVMEVRGHSWETNLPARHVIYTRDLYEPVQELASRIAAAARGAGLEVLELQPEPGIQLPGYQHGFLGGCCGKLSASQLAFCGDFTALAQHQTIKAFLARFGVEPVSLIPGPMQDIGGWIVLAEKD